MNDILIRNGRILDPANAVDKIGDLYIADGRIQSIDVAPADFKTQQTIDADGLWVIPGIIDLSARLREPGLEYKADIASETVAATSAGITTLCVPPDTDPVIDEPAVVDLIHRKVARVGHARVVALGALTAGLRGEHLSEMAALERAGCVGVSNGRHPLTNALVLRRSLEYAATRDITVFIEPNDGALSNQGCAHEGAIATRLGLPPIPYAAETAAIAHTLELVTDTGVRVHFCRLSCSRSVDLIAQAQQAGLKVSADVAAHQLFLTEMDINSFNTNCHVLPPLRTQRDMQSLRSGVKQNIIGAICSDHQPHEIDAKLAPFPSTEPGISALETLLPLTLKLVKDGELDINTAIAKLTCEPAAILGVNLGNLGSGTPADVCIVDPEKEWTLDVEQMKSRGRNTPFHGWNFVGKTKHTLVKGKLVYSAE